MPEVCLITLSPLRFSVCLSPAEEDEGQQCSRLRAVLCQKQVMLTQRGGKKTVKNCHKLGEKHENCNPGRKLGAGNKKNRGVCWEGLAGMFSAKPEMITAC